MTKSEFAEHGDLIGKSVLVPWPGKSGVKIPFKVVDCAHRYGHWQLKVSYAGSEESFWTRTWIAPT